MSADGRTLSANADSLTCTRVARTIIHENPHKQIDRQTERIKAMPIPSCHVQRSSASADVRSLDAYTDSLTCTSVARTITHENPHRQTDR